MLRTTCSNKGFTMVEVLIAMFIVAVGIIALMSMQPLSWQISGKSDLLGRAAGMLEQELESMELTIMNPNNAIPASGTKTVYASGMGAAEPIGDVPYTVQTTIVNAGSAWTVTVKVTWPGNTRGISESLIVSRQESFRM
jgi:prepilin-type N-terminal cleavage/methylation domain-containing protein